MRELIDKKRVFELVEESTFDEELYDGENEWLIEKTDKDILEMKLREEPSEKAFTEQELRAWLWEIIHNNYPNDFSEWCEELISRLDGFERFVADMRGE